MRQEFRRAQSYFTIIMTLEILLGFVIIILTIVYQSLLIRFIADMERKVFVGQFINVYIFGVQLIVVYVSGVFMWQHLWQYKYTTATQLFITAWVFLTFIIIVNGIGTIYSLYRCAGSLQNSAEMSLRKGMDMYFESPEWKLLWDGLQFHKQCCGVRGYKDWMKASWILEARTASTQVEENNSCNNESIAENAAERQTRSADVANSILAPYACCKQSSKNCYARYMPQVGAQRKDIPTLSESDINTNGCLPIFTHTMWLLLHVLGACVVLAFILNICLCFYAHKIVSKHLVCRSDPGDMNFFDDQGRPVLYLKYPPNISCVTVNETPRSGSKKPIEAFKSGQHHKEDDKCQTAKKEKDNDSVSYCTSPRPPMKVCEFCGKLRKPEGGCCSHSDTEACQCTGKSKLDAKKSSSKLSIKLCGHCGKQKRPKPKCQPEQCSPCRGARKYNTLILH